MVREDSSSLEQFKKRFFQFLCNPKKSKKMVPSNHHPSADDIIRSLESLQSLAAQRRKDPQRLAVWSCFGVKNLSNHSAYLSYFSVGSAHTLHINTALSDPFRWSCGGPSRRRSTSASSWIGRTGATCGPTCGPARQFL